ncbi:hypothetical protein SH591_02935 [Sphingomonas sp. LY54]|uniref:hypothetical protein n=1 Tax=Sphingomonas sp. LY54 TaxID=3095343 RepID=UPI002D79CFB6|nr:hypothetical protein [Sphingomonas sp. LY54]WRP29154.1 hypothetical protein SH591_02935 [Sphingomonas sp. LY54]
MTGLWTLRRATGIGVAAGLAALVLWPVYAAWQEAVRLPYVAALALSAFCGLSILAFTAIDLVQHRKRGRRLRPIRVFDLVLALLLAVPPLLVLEALRPLP